MNENGVVFTTLVKSTCVFSEKSELNSNDILAITYQSLGLEPSEDYVTGHILTELLSGSLLFVFAAKKQKIKKLAKDKGAKIIFPFWMAYKAPSDASCCLLGEYDDVKFIACYAKSKLIAVFLLDEFSLDSISFKINEISKNYGIFFDEIYTTKDDLSGHFTPIFALRSDIDGLEFASLYKTDERFGLKSKLVLSAFFGLFLGVGFTTYEYFSHEYSKNLSNIKLNRSILISEQAKLKDLALKIDDLRAQKESLVKSQEPPGLEIAYKSDKSKVLEKLITLAKKAGVKISSVSVNRQSLTLIATSSEYVKISSFISLILDDFAVVWAKNTAINNGFEVSIKARKKYAR